MKAMTCRVLVVMFCVFNVVRCKEESYRKLRDFVSLSGDGEGQDNDAFSSAIEPGVCGVQIARKARVVGGEEAYRGEFPWMVSIQHKGNHFCGGALIAAQWVLSAAHCFNDYRMKNTSNYRIVIGDHNIKEKEKHDTAVKLGAEKIIPHTEFNSTRYVNDIALIKLKEAVNFDKYKIPICLPTNEIVLKEGDNVTVAGWGYASQFKPVITDVLGKAPLKLVTNNLCQAWYKEAGMSRLIQVHATHICAGYREGKKDSCKGDSGGPLMKKDNNRYVIIGIVSSGIGCARPLLPGLYTNVAAFLDWIETNMKK